MTEIEILVQVYDSEENAMNVLSSICTFSCETTNIDIYFHDEIRKGLSPNESCKTLESLRIRKKNDNTLLTYKYDHYDNNGIWSHSDEHEVMVADFEKIQSILCGLGYKPLIIIENKRKVYLTDEYEIVLDSVKGLGLFLEVEATKTDTAVSVADQKKKIREFIAAIGLSVSDELNCGKPELMLRKNTTISKR